MRTGGIVLLTLVLVGGMVSAGWAGEAKKPAEQPAAGKAAPGLAQLRAKMLRTQAALIEAQVAEEPDAQKIERLQEQLAAVCQKLAALAGSNAGSPRGVGVCPWGGPGLGRGVAWGGARQGHGRGCGAGWGCGAGRGHGWAYTDTDRNGICDNFEAARPLK